MPYGYFPTRREKKNRYLDNEAANVAIITYTVTDGPEEMHLFFPLAWFDAGSWAWAHFIQEWASKGVFMVSFGHFTRIGYFVFRAFGV